MEYLNGAAAAVSRSVGVGVAGAAPPRLDVNRSQQRPRPPGQLVRRDLCSGFDLTVCSRECPSQQSSTQPLYCWHGLAADKKKGSTWLFFFIGYWKKKKSLFYS